MKNSQDTAQTTKEMLNELQTLVDEAEAMISGAVSETSSEACRNLRERFGAAQERVTEAYQSAKKNVVAGARYTDDTIRANPYQSLAIAAGVGLLVGVLIGRRTT